MRSTLRVHGSIIAAFVSFGITTTPQPAAAQSLFDALFGGPKPSYHPPGAYPNTSRLLPPGGINAGQPYAIRQMPQPRRDDDDDGHRSSKSSDSGHGGHHTVCVRMCDGFYWPVSYSAPRSRFYRDANACSSSCNSEAKLFHYPTKGGEMQDAVDLTGRAYSRLPNAFKYRKTLVQGCTCKPEPWSEAEVQRHRGYAINEELAQGSKLAAAPAKAPELPAPPRSGQQENVRVSDATDDAEPASRQTPDPAATPAIANAEPVTPVRKAAARVRTADGNPAPTRARLRQTAPLPPVRINKVAGPGNAGGLWGGGQSQYTWPGDAPIRTR